MLRWVGRGLLGLLGLGFALVAFVPGETPGLLPPAFVPEEETPEATVRTVIDSEALIDGVRDGALKEVVWARQDRARTKLALVYVHGFSASKAELRPVPERVAARLGANLFLTRLTGHGRGGAAMGLARAEDWMRDMAEAVAVGKALGQRVVLIGTSMGGALTALAASQLEDDPAMAGYVLVSPAFGLRAVGTSLLTLPFARVWVPWLLGPERSFTPLNAAQAEGWTTAYPSRALVPLGGVVREAQLTPYDHVTRPALFVFSDEDAVVAPERIRAAAEDWGGAVDLELLALGEGDDPDRHVVAGAAMSPGMTDRVATRIADWVEARILAPDDAGASGEDGGDRDGG